MRNYIRKLGFISICMSIVLIIISIFMIVKPIETIGLVIVLLGYVLVVYGLIHFISYFNIRDEYRFFSFELGESIIDVILGFLVVLHTDTVEVILPIVIGIWIIMQGITELQVAFNIRGIRGTKWGIVFLMSLISIALGISIVFKPVPSFDVMTRLAGAVLLYSEIITLYDNIYFITQVKDIEKTVKEIEEDNK